LRGFTNERNEFLITTLPVAPLSSSSVAPSMTLPQFADGGGWATQVLLINPTQSPISGSIEFWGQGSAAQSASPLSIAVNGATGSSFNYLIPPGGVNRFVTAGVSPAVQVGSVRIKAASQNVIPQALAIFSLKSGNATTAEASVPGLADGTAFSTYIEYSTLDQINAGVAIANPSASAAAVYFEITALDGTPTGLAGSVQIPAGGQITKFLSELFPGLPSSQTGILRVTSPTPISVIGLRARFSERGTFLITTIPVSNESATIPSSTEVVFPHAVSGGGYDTKLILFNSAAGMSASGNLRFFMPDGTPAARLSH
jgi:hypothetical protein